MQEKKHCSDCALYEPSAVAPGWGWCWLGDRFRVSTKYRRPVRANCICKHFVAVQGSQGGRVVTGAVTGAK